MDWNKLEEHRFCDCAVVLNSPTTATNAIAMDGRVGNVWISNMIVAITAATIFVVVMTA